MQKMEKNKNMQTPGNRSTCFCHQNTFKRNLRQQKSNCINRKMARIESDELSLKKRFSQISSVLNFAMFLAMIVCRFFGGDGSSLFFLVEIVFSDFFL